MGLGATGAAIVPPRGNYTCFNCRTASIEFPGVCQGCADQFKVREFNAALQLAVDSIPSMYSWAGGVCAKGDAQERFRAAADRYIADWQAIAPQIAAARKALMSGETSTVVFYGPDSHFGKTSAAAVLLRWFIEQGRWRNLSPDEMAIARMHDVGAPMLAPPEWKELARRIARARGARFVHTSDLQAPPGIIPAEVLHARDVAATAPILLLDDIGHELHGVHANATNRPDLRGTQDVIHARSERPELWTIATTWLSRDAMAEFLGANIRARVFQRSFVICIGPNARREDT